MKAGNHYAVIANNSGHAIPIGSVVKLIRRDLDDNCRVVYMSAAGDLDEDLNADELGMVVTDKVEPQKPAHYDTGIDTIAFMRANCPPEQVEGFLRGNALKYLQRYPNKNGVDDLRKAAHYVQMLIEEVEGRD